MSFHGYKEISTPNIDKLAGEGVILNSMYSLHICTPSRIALMTAKYPFRFGKFSVAGTCLRLSVTFDEELDYLFTKLPLIKHDCSSGFRIAK